MLQVKIESVAVRIGNPQTHASPAGKLWSAWLNLAQGTGAQKHEGQMRTTTLSSFMDYAPSC